MVTLEPGHETGQVRQTIRRSSWRLALCNDGQHYHPPDKCRLTSGDLMSSNNTTAPNKVRTPARRARSIALLLMAGPVLAWETLNSAWYVMAFEAPSVVLPKSYTTVENVSATAIFTGWDLIKPGTAGSLTGVAQAVGDFAGYPAPLVLLTAGVILAIAGTAARSSLLTFLSVIPMFFSHNSLGVTRQMVENPIFGGQYMYAQPAMWRFSLIVLASIAFCFMLTIAVFLSGRSERKAKIAAGEKVEPSLLDLMSAYNSRILDQADALQEHNRRSDSIKV